MYMFIKRLGLCRIVFLHQGLHSPHISLLLFCQITTVVFLVRTRKPRQRPGTQSGRHLRCSASAWRALVLPRQKGSRYDSRRCHYVTRAGGRICKFRLFSSAGTILACHSQFQILTAVSVSTQSMSGNIGMLLTSHGVSTLSSSLCPQNASCGSI